MPNAEQNAPIGTIARTILTCTTVVASALTAGGIFCFPLFAPTLAEHLMLSQPQLSTIALAGMSGQYPFAALCGEVIDRWGPWATSLSASVFFALGFGWFSHEISKFDYIEPSSPGSPFTRLVICFFFCGIATASSMFTILFSATRAFPGHTGLSAGLSTVFFGLSPFILSYIASCLFSNESGDLDVTSFLCFLSVLAGVAHFLGFAVLKLVPSPVVTPPEHPEEEVIDNVLPALHPHPHEQTPLLSESAQPVVKPNGAVRSVDNDQTVWELLQEVDFWLLLASMLLILGSCEMVMGNVGTMILGLPVAGAPPFISKPPSTAATQVRLISICNTLSRLIVGPLADFVAPVALVRPDGELYFPRKRYMSRLGFLCLSSIVMVVAHFWMAAFVHSQEDVYLLSIATGLAYGGSFTVIPSIVASLWVGKNAGRNFGAITYAPFIGTPIFSYLYAFNAASAVPEGEVCTGRHCWRSTFWIACAGSVVALLLTIILYRRGRGHV